MRNREIVYAAAPPPIVRALPIISVVASALALLLSLVAATRVERG